MITLRTFYLLLLAAFLVQPAMSVPDHRAQTWKPQRMLGSAQLSMRQIAYVIRPESGSSALDAAIEDFLNLMEARYGAKPLIVTTGVCKNALQFKMVADRRERGAFTIRRVRTRLIIQAADAEGWSNGLYAIMQEQMGARWYWAGALGFDWVEPSRRYLPNRPWREEPSFVQRRLYPADSDFARRNRLNSAYSFNHNLAKVFTLDLFSTQPEVFSELRGRRRPPRGSGATDPQPDFTEPKAVEVASRAALDHFNAHPESTSYSLSINDNVLFDTSERTKAAVSPIRYFRGRPNYTDLVFTFMNQVAERVFDQAGAWQTPAGEDRYLTALAYYWTEPSPSVPLHPRVMPVLTSDRAQWHDPSYRAEDKALIRAWAASGAERVATWDYYFGAPYIYPRQFNQWIAESLQYLAASGVDVFFSQLPSFWGLDGAKAWLAAQLLWDVEQDAEQLLAEYYDTFFGAASVPMRDFYEIAEAHRNVHEGTAEWIKLYKDESGVALFTPEVLEQMRTRLDQSLPLLADDTQRQARVEVVSEAFYLTELYAEYDRSRRELVDLCLSPLGTPSELIEAQLQAFRKAREAYRDYMETYLTNSDYAPERRHVDRRQSNPEALALAVLQQSSADAFESLCEDPGLTHLTYAQRDFLSPRMPNVNGWYLDYRPSEDFRVIASEWGGGAAGLRIEQADILSVFRTFPIRSEQTYELRIRAAWKISLDNRVHVHVSWLDMEGGSLSSEVPLRLPYGVRGRPVDIRLPLTAPAEANDVRIRVVVSRQYAGDYLDISELDFGSVNESMLPVK